MTSAPLDDLAGTRVAYTAGTLTEDDLAPTPLGQFERWFADARRAARDGRLVEPNAMTLATAGADGVPVARTVLLKGVADDGFEFFTDLASRKARAIRERGRVALLLPWIPLQRQVAVLGVAEELPRDRVAEYFRARPYGSRIGALAGRQSEVAVSRQEIDAAAATTAAAYPDTGSPDDVPVPAGWGGYRVRPVEVEFWQGRPSRLHDRLVFVARAGAPALLGDPAGWRVERRWP